MAFPTHGLLRWLLALFARGQKRHPIAANSDSRIAAATVVAQRSPNEAVLADEQKTGLGDAVDIHEVLEQLPNYFSALKALRKFDEDCYSIFSTLGAPLAPKATSWLQSSAIPASILSAPPAIRCITFAGCNEPDKDKIYASFVYMQHLGAGQVCVARNGGLVKLPSGGPCFRLVMVFRDKHAGDHANSCYVQINEDGVAELLPERRVDREIVGRGKHRHTFAKQTVKRPEWIRELAADHDREEGEYLQFLCAATLSAERPKHSIIVTARHGSLAASWTVDRRDAKRFFRQRETGNAADGKRRRILHYVAPFVRETASGPQFVREHYRGERSFTWNGYDIDIAGLGFHHADFFDASIPAFEDARNEQMISLARASKLVRDRCLQARFLSAGGAR